MNPSDSISSTLTRLSNQSGTITTILNLGGTLSRSNSDTVVSKPAFCLSYTAYGCEIVRHTAGKNYIPNLLPLGKVFIVKPARLRLSVLTVKLYLFCLLLLLGPIITFYPKEAHREMLGMAFTSAIFITAQFFALFFPTDPNVGYKFGCFSLRAEENVISLIRDGGEW